MIYYEISEYVKAKNEYKLIPGRITEKGIEYLINGEWTKNKPSVPTYSKYNPLNPDKTFIP